MEEDSRLSAIAGSINTIATFPTDNIHGKGIWHPITHGEKVAEDGTTSFKINGDDCDYLQLQPEYFQQADRKWEHLWNNGFVVFMESVRRSEAWPEQSPVEKDAFVNYTRFLWARWGCYNMIYSWLHMDADQNKSTIRLLLKLYAAYEILSLNLVNYAF